MEILDERSRKILCAIVENYINLPDPVGSRTVAKGYPFGISPATIRNIMADLEDMGFLEQPHTSAGRVPTDLGYRFYVDAMMNAPERLNAAYIGEMNRKLEDIRNNIDALFIETSRAISRVSHYLGVAMSPNPELTTLNRIELLKYRTGKLAAILFTDEGLIRNKIIPLENDMTQRDLNRIASYLNSEFSGLSFDEIRVRIIRDMSQEKVICDKLISRAISICREAMSFPFGDLFVSGLAEVLDLPDFANLQKIKELSRAIEEKHTIIKLLEKLSGYDGVQIVIGAENTVLEMKQFSMVVSSCRDAGRPVGIVGIIGPTRMDYLKAISIVDNTAKFISKMLSER
jgi:heat-inducible transcriptional repressor